MSLVSFYIPLKCSNIITGSILVSFTISGQTIAVDDTVEALWVELGNGIVLTYGDLNLQAAQYLAVDGDERLPANEEVHYFQIFTSNNECNTSCYWKYLPLWPSG